MTGKPKILIVDDDPLNVKLMAAKLPKDRYETLKAYNGQQALEKVKRAAPDIILLDIMMPGMDGYEVTRKLKNDPDTRDIPVILVTALDGTDDKIKGLEAGADEFLNKPVNTVELSARVRSFLRIKKYQDQLKTRRDSKQLFSTPEEQERYLESTFEKPSVLLVEDDDKDVRLIQGYLNGEGYNLSLVRDGEETLSRVRGDRVDLLLLDILLPGIDGFEVCRRLKDDEPTRDIQIVVITCLQDLESKIKGLELGVDDFLVKPINKYELQTRLKALLKKKKYLDRLHVNYETAIYYAITDRRTGLHNHGYFEHMLETEIKRSLRQKHPVSLLMMDIDDFKQYNDTLGHLAGDEILGELGKLIKRNIREVDLGARYGGEEFAIILPYTDKAGARIVAERIIKMINAHPFRPELRLSSKNLTVSIGIASFSSDANSARDLVQKADKALYAAKEQGKNRVCVSDGPSVD
ncbi:MAG: response regulator [Desulfobacterales bacterium]|jgi:two-component system cell cycle response regulator